MNIRFIPLLAVSALLTGCSTLSGLKDINGTATSITETDNYGLLAIRVSASGIVKTKDGTLTVGHYDGQIAWLGFGPHTIIEGLQLQTPPPAPVPSK